VYAGQSIVGQVALLGVRPDGTSVELPHVLARPGGYRFLPDGSFTIRHAVRGPRKDYLSATVFTRRGG